MTTENRTFKWNHTSLEMVDHFNVLVEGTPADQLFKVNSTEVVIPRFPGISFNVSFSAVDICGRESESIQLQGIVIKLLTNVECLLPINVVLYSEREPKSWWCNCFTKSPADSDLLHSTPQ